MVRYNSIIAIFAAFASTSKADIMDGILSEDEKQALLDEHNELRSTTALGNTGDEPMAKNMVKLEWDEDLAEQAKGHADLCVWEHSSGNWGENLAASAAQVTSQLSFATLMSGVTNWYNEHNYYTFDSDSCSGVCGHYTQVVWATSTKVGCAYQICGPGFIWDDTFPYQTFLVCQYTPPGNYWGQLPYAKATTEDEIASECPDGYVGNSETGLCEMPSATTPTMAPTSGFTTPEPTSSGTDLICLDSTLNVLTTTLGCDDLVNLGACSYFQVASHCPLSCGECEEYACSDSVLSFASASGRQINCGMLASLEQPTIDEYCANEAAYTTCRETCNTCSMDF